MCVVVSITKLNTEIKKASYYKSPRTGGKEVDKVLYQKLRHEGAVGSEGRRGEIKATNNVFVVQFFFSF